MQRYLRNFPSLSESEQSLLLKSSVCVAGCGGLGGYSIELLARIGIGKITVIDGDIFDETNLNRQLLSKESNIGINKALSAKKRIKQINPEIECTAIETFLNENNAEELINGHDVVIDALDDIPSRFILQSACKKISIPMIHGAVEDWYGQVSTIFPNDDTLQKIYSGNLEKTKISGTLAFAPPIISSIQVSEAVKVIIKRGTLLRYKLLVVDLLDQTFCELKI